MKRYYTWILLTIFIIVVVVGIVFVINTIEKQDSVTEQMSDQEFTDYYQEFGLQDENTIAYVRQILETQVNEGVISDQSICSSVEQVLPVGGKLIELRFEKQTLMIDYVQKSDSVYTKRIVLSYDGDGIQKIDIRQEHSIIILFRNNLKKVIQIT